MDVLTHFVAPYLTMWAFRRPHRERLAAGIGGLAPDIDVLLAPLAHFVPSLYMLGHRGVTHTLWGAPLAALLLVLVLRLPFWARRWPRMEALSFGSRLALIAMAFSYTHLLLDGLTLWGPPLLWPLLQERFAARWMFSAIFILAPVSAFVVYRLVRGSATPRVLRVSAIVLVALFVLTGAVRAATFPGEPEGGYTQAGPLDWQWVQLEPAEGGWNVTYWSWREQVGARFYPDEVGTLEGDAREALAAARESVKYRAFRFAAGGPLAVQVTPLAEDAWEVRFLDLLVESEADRWRGAQLLMAGRGELRMVVYADGSAEAS